MSGQSAPAPLLISRLQLEFVPPDQRVAVISRWADDLVHQISVEFGRLSALLDAPMNGTGYVRQDGAWTALDSVGAMPLAFDFGTAAPSPGDERAILLVSPARLPAGLTGSLGEVVTPGVADGTVDLFAGSALVGTATIGINGLVVFSQRQVREVALPAGTLVRAVVGAVVPASLAGIRITVAAQRA